VTSVARVGIYTAVGVAIWVAFVKSGVHATVAGVLLGLLTPARPYLPRGAFARWLETAAERMRGDVPSSAHSAAQADALQRGSRAAVSLLEYLEFRLHPWVSFAIMPIFALANAAVQVSAADLRDPVALAVAVSLLAGKAIGILAASWLAVALRAGRLPDGVSWTALAGGGVLCGIGFTMALFIANLALSDSALGAAKVGILLASALGAVVGMLVLVASGKRRATPTCAL
jgi:NhaA family Na+:H+ antiporter